jgi:hypothetical protein
MNQFDHRQLIKMRQLINGFKDDAINLSSFISSMEFLFHQLKSVDEVWDELFLEEIANLESVNAGVPPSISKAVVNNIILETIDNLDKLVVGKLN